MALASALATPRNAIEMGHRSSVSQAVCVNGPVGQVPCNASGAPTMSDDISLQEQVPLRRRATLAVRLNDGLDPISWVWKFYSAIGYHRKSLTDGSLWSGSPHWTISATGSSVRLPDVASAKGGGFSAFSS